MNDGPPDPGSRELLASTRTQEVHENVGELTPARVGIGRVGVSLPTAARLQLRLDHARARDAVRHAFDADGVVEALTATGREAIAVTSAAVAPPPLLSFFTPSPSNPGQNARVEGTVPSRK